MTRHPQKEILEQFATGDLQQQLAVLVAAHLENCSDCKKQVKLLEDKKAELNLGRIDEEIVPDFSSLLNKITNPSGSERLESDIVKLEEKIIMKNKRVQNNSLELGEKSFDIPLALAPLLDLRSPWKTTVQNIKYSRVNLSGPCKMYFFYFEPGSEIPEHSHTANEYNYVVAGHFSDRRSDYITGDFVCFDPSDQHAPITNDPDGCLVLLCSEGPLKFQKGLARLVNPFSHFIF